MAASNAPRPWRALAFVGIILVGLYLGVAFGGATKPQLGLDLRGGTQAILTAQTQNGGKVNSSALSKAVEIIRQRVNGIGVAEAQVTTQGNDNIVVAVPGAGHDEVVSRVGKTAQLRFRQVLQETNAAPAATPQQSSTPAPTPSSSVKPSAGSSAKPSPQPSASTSANKRAITSDLLAAGSASASPSAAPSATPSTTPSASPSATPSASSNALPSNASPQQLFATVDCTNPKVRESLSALDKTDQTIVACSNDGTAKYLLAPAKVLGTAVKSASASLAQQGWQVNLTFNGSGTKAWADLTTKVTNLQPPQNQVAIVLDGQVVSAPRIIEPILGGNAQITGTFTQSEAKDLANVLKYGALPLKFELSSVTTVSPTLGSDQLRGGLIAGLIGIGLVLVYSFLYYRLLGLIVFASLALSGGMLYAATTLLGQSINYTLTLAGIAGFIVAIGITADSFVVYFERIKDELREGRSASLRSAVERAWPRARRTILSADTVSILAAVILYLLSVGGVRGFAFTLGLSTLADLFIVFLFTKPLMTILVQTPLYRTTHRFSGLSVERMGGVPAAPLSRRSRSAATREELAAPEGAETVSEEA